MATLVYLPTQVLAPFRPSNIGLALFEIDKSGRRGGIQ
jgi:hypothetical protein